MVTDGVGVFGGERWQTTLTVPKNISCPFACLVLGKQKSPITKCWHLASYHNPARKTLSGTAAEQTLTNPAIRIAISTNAGQSSVVCPKYV